MTTKPTHWTSVITGKDTPIGADIQDGGDHTKGCHSCGAITINTGPRPSGGQYIWYRAASECCPWNIKREIGWRQDEIADIRKRMDSDEEVIAKLKAEASITRPHERTRLEAVIERSERVQAEKQRTRYGPEMRELGAEITRLRTKLAGMEAA